MKYIYERNPDTGEIFRREKGNYDKRELINKTENMNMMSLYDYLGHAAGPELGQQVAKAAAIAKVKHEIREVKHAGWNGPIMLYPKSFLDNFFGGGLNEGTSGKQLLKG
jgi:hypothetical protein|tara:strand:- start:1802 stop:2128 length:327 start_codon:yes stop_codon:yes gene_type:complete